MISWFRHNQKEEKLSRWENDALFQLPLKKTRIRKSKKILGKEKVIFEEVLTKGEAFLLEDRIFIKGRTNKNLSIIFFIPINEIAFNRSGIKHPMAIHPITLNCGAVFGKGECHIFLKDNESVLIDYSVEFIENKVKEYIEKQ